MAFKLNPFTGNFDEVSDLSNLVVGPSSATDNAIARFDGTTGKLVQNSLASVNDSGQISLGADASSAMHAVTYQQMNTADGLLIPLTQKGASNGVATLDAGGKVPVSQLPNSIMEFKGVWDASTNTPTLADGTGNAGDVYLVSVAGTQNLGSGNITFAAGDWAVHDGSIWQKSVNSNSVVSVNGYTGVVSLTSSDIAEGTNLYFTDERAQDAVGAMVANSAKVSLTYVDGTPSLTADIVTGSLVDADISATAAIGYSKLNLATSIVNGDISASAAIAYSKLNLASSIVNADVSNSAAIAYSKLNLASSIVDGDISASAAISLSKLAALTANRAVVSNASGVLVSSSVTDTEIGYISGVTSSIQTQLNSKKGEYTFSAITSNTSAVAGVMYLVGTDTAAITVTLPAVATQTRVLIKDADGNAMNNNITIAGGGANIDNSSSVTVSGAYEAVELICDGTDWWRI